MVITVASIGYLVAGLVTFLPYHVLVVVPAPYLWQHPALKVFVEGLTAAAIEVLSRAVVVVALVTRSLVDSPVRFPPK